jgi:hypothetical protein
MRAIARGDRMSARRTPARKAIMDTRREFLATLGVGLIGMHVARAEQSGQAAAPPPVRKVKTTTLFKSPEGYPNGIAATPEGVWIAEQRSDVAHLVDWNGKPLK